MTVITIVVQTENENGYIAEAEGFDLIAQGETLTAAINALISDLHEYSSEYMAEFDLYHTAPNRAAHLPIVKAILAQQ